MSFNPNDVGVDNGNLCGLPFVENAKLRILPVPLDVTASYRKGTSRSYVPIRDASLQIDLFHPNYSFSEEASICLEKDQLKWREKNEEFKEVLKPFFISLSNGEEGIGFETLISDVTKFQKEVNNGVIEFVVDCLGKNQIPAILGGEHSVMLGCAEALSSEYSNFGILQFDAHADLRSGYEGFEFSHASIMHNVLKNQSVSKLIQVGVRDLCSDEVQRIEEDERIVTFFNNKMQEAMFNGVNFNAICEEIIDQLPELVYVSCDVDVLEPAYCPDTGTPVPGGLSYNQLVYLLRKVANSGKKIIGFDLCEVTPGENEINSIVGARLLWELSLATLKTSGE